MLWFHAEWDRASRTTFSAAWSPMTMKTGRDEINHTMRRAMNLHPAVILMFTAWLVSGCATSPSAAPDVVALLQPTTGNSVTGAVRFKQDGPLVLVHGRISGLAPNQEYGFHVHEKGDCSSGDGMSAGGHFNPTGKPHGPPDGEHHAGDLPSLKADASGTAVVDVRVAGSVLGSGASDFYGKAVVVHALPDDYTTQPSGNSGPRIACGVIGTSAARDAAGNPVLVPKDL